MNKTSAYRIRDTKEHPKAIIFICDQEEIQDESKYDKSQLLIVDRFKPRKGDNVRNNNKDYIVNADSYVIDGETYIVVNNDETEGNV